jgi:hypothetical protein
MLSTRLCLVLPSGFLPSGFPTDILYTFLFSLLCATCPAHLILDLITLIILGEEYKSYQTDKKQKIEIKSSDSIQSTYSNWETVKYVALQGSILRSLLFLICINDFPPTLKTSSIAIISADDTSVIISGKNVDDSHMLSNKVLSQMSN